ncbi:MAG: hypothetical protein JW895_09315 [Thermoleophilaceae bacterium]|nr:hypothetical protein [Thermoleophilaceae bacterium]
MLRIRAALAGAAAGVLGLLPHILHHAGPLAGAALFAGVGGSLFFGLLGLVAAIPLLLRMHGRCGSWRRPAGFLLLMAAVFSISTFAIGPLISGDSSGESGAPERGLPGHELHHR